MNYDNFTPKELVDIEKIQLNYISKGETDEDKLIRRYQCFPLDFVMEVLGLDNQEHKPTTQQKELLDAVGKLCFCKMLRFDFEKAHQLDKLPRAVKKMSARIGISIRAGRGVGKSACSTWLTYWFILMFPDAKIPCVGPTEQVLKTILWQELYLWLNKLNDKGDYYFNNMFRNRIDLKASNLVCDNNPNQTAFQRVSPRNSDIGQLKGVLGGLHSQNMLILVDETSAISDPVFEPLESTLTGRNNIIVALFNPTRNSGYAWRTHFDPSIAESYVKLHWSGEESEIVSSEYLVSLKRKYGGADSTAYRVSVLGEPPSSDDNSLIPYAWVADSMFKTYHNKEYNNYKVICSLDVARSGGDNTVLCIRRGNWVKEFKTFNIIDSQDLAQSVYKYITSIYKSLDDVYICVDPIGIGAGVYDQIRRLHRNTYSVNVATSPTDKQYQNLRAELWFRMRAAFQTGAMILPENTEAREQLSTVRYEIANGKIKIEGKDSIRKRIGCSSDYADSLMMSYYILNDNKVEMLENEVEDPYDRAFNNVRGETSWMAI